MDVASLQVIIKTQGVEAAQKELDKLSGTASKAEKSVGGLASSFKTLGPLIAVGAIVELGKQFAKVSDNMTLVEARIRLVSKASEDYMSIQNRLLEAANENRVSFKEMGELYARLATPLKSLGANTQTIIDITDAFGKTLLISGASASEANGAIRQFSQAMASGVLRGEEFNSMMENAPRAMKSLQESLGKTQGELRKMAENGELAAGVVAGALLRDLTRLEDESSRIPKTIGGEFEKLWNQLGVSVQKFNEVTEANKSLANAVTTTTGWLEKMTIEFVNASKAKDDFLKENNAGFAVMEEIAAVAGTINEKQVFKNLFDKKAPQDFTTAMTELNTEMATFNAIVNQGKGGMSPAKSIAQMREDAAKNLEAKAERERLEKEAKKQLDQALTEYKAYYQAIGDNETVLAIKRREYAEKYKNLTAQQIEAIINSERGKNNKTEELAKKWAEKKLEIQTEMSIAEQDELAKPFLKLQLEYQKDLEEFKSVVGAKEFLAKNFNAKYQRLGLDTTKKLDEKAQKEKQKEKQKDIQKELKLQEENFRIQARQVELLDDEADKQVALATLEYQRTQASLKAQMELGEVTPQYYNAMMEMEDKLLEKQKQNWTLAGQVVNNVTSQMESSMTDFLDATSDNFADFGKMATSILQEVYREIIRISVVKPLVSSLTSGAISLIPSLFGGVTSGGVTASAEAWQSAGAYPNAMGGVYNSPSLSAYSNQVVSKPTMFAFASGGVPNMGVFGEAGSEAIMPLTRTSNGDLGVKAEGMGLNQVKIQIINESGTQMEVTKTSQTSDVEGMVIQAWISGISKNRYGSRQLLQGS